MCIRDSYFENRKKGKGKGSGHSGKGKSSRTFGFLVDGYSNNLYSPETYAEGIAYLAGMGAPQTSGKGKGRKRNPIGKDGQVLKCFGCGSETHLREK